MDEPVFNPQTLTLGSLSPAAIGELAASKGLSSTNPGRLKHFTGI
jgi:hypothetical protein